jgi:nicotinate-nucleotide pyrophosphorylase (carboxylating)
MLPKFYYDEIILKALKEDINYLDVTTEYLIPDNQESDAVFLAKDDGVLCGINIALRVFELLDDSIKAEIFKNDGDILQKGDIIANIHGKTKALLMGERTSLNLLQHMSGVATGVHTLAELIKHTKAKVADTRKTLPGLRALQKYAVTVGGGKNHRFNLTDAAMIKDNHIDAVGSITKAVNALRKRAGHTIKIEVETRNLDEVREALEVKAEIIMLDNMSCEQMKQAVEIVDGRALLEASGNITEYTIKNIAETGVDIISVGAITHSATAMDISMKIK